MSIILNKQRQNMSPVLQLLQTEIKKNPIFAIHNKLLINNLKNETAVRQLRYH